MLDTVGLKIAWDRLIAIVTDGGKFLERTAFSSVVREGKDYAVIVTDALGNSVAQPWDCAPSFLGTLPRTMKEILQQMSARGRILEPGDAVITNDPWIGTGDLNDINVASPIYVMEDLVGFAIATAHVADIGGTTGFASATDVYSEGLRIPISMLMRRGEINSEVEGFLHANVRLSSEVWGDIIALATTVDYVSQRVAELVEEIQVSYPELAELIQNRTRLAMAEAIGDLGSGPWRATTQVETAREDFPLVLTLRRQGNPEVLVADFSGSAAQTTTAVNSVYGYTFAFTAFALKTVLSPEVPNNEGCFSAFDVIAPPGTIVNARPPAAIRLRPLVGHRIADLVFLALAEALENQVIAPSGSTPTFLQNVVFPDSNGRHRVYWFGYNGGTGAGTDFNGRVGCFPANHGGTPVEVLEAGTPLMIMEKRLAAGSGGAGRWRGGPGQVITFRNASERPVTVNTILPRQRYGAAGVNGGQEGGRYEGFLNGRKLEGLWGGLDLGPGDEVRILYPGGGGFGPVHESVPPDATERATERATDVDRDEP